MYNPNRVWKFFKSFTAEKTFTAKLCGGLCFGPELDRFAAPTPILQNNCDIEVDIGYMSTGVEIVLQISDKTSTCLVTF